MKKILVMFLMLLGLSACAKGDDIFVLPLFVSENNPNAYGFETASEITAEEIIQNFLLGKSVNTERFENVKSQIAGNYSVREVAEKYRKTGLVDFEKLSKAIGASAPDKALLVFGLVEDENGTKLDPWDILKLASDFQIDYPYVLITKVVLVDTKEGVALWQKSYNMSLASAKKSFVAPTYSRASEQYEKIRSFSKNVIAKDVEENLNVRLNSKTIDFGRNVKRTNSSEEGVGLKYYKKGIPVKITPPAETMEEQLLKDDTFSL